MRIITLPQCVSTNDEAKKIPIRPENPRTIVTAAIQTGGRGSKGRTWQSTEGGLYMSLLLCEKELSRSDTFPLTYRTALAVCDTLSIFLPERPKIKWPNDIVAHKKKICGILTETQYEGNVPKSAIIGIGININQPKSAFAAEFAPYTTSLFIETGKKTTLNAVLTTLAANLDKRLDEDAFEEYKSQCITLGAIVTTTINNRTIEGKATDITKEGLLIIDTGTEQLPIFTEATIRPKNGYA